jgi:hypothetical protein
VRVSAPRGVMHNSAVAVVVYPQHDIVDCAALSHVAGLETRPFVVKQVTESPPSVSDRSAAGVPHHGVGSAATSSDESAPTDISIVIQTKDGAQFTVISTPGQIQQIGDLLRGKPKGIDRRTVLTSIAATIGTLFISSLIAGVFQYVSWLNSVRLQNAVDHASKAAAVYDKAGLAIGTRNFTTLNYLLAVQNTVNTRGVSHDLMSKVARDQDQKKIAEYVDMRQAWNTGYDQILADLDYTLDRPILLATGQASQRIIATQTDKIDCAYPINKQMDHVGMNRHTLKGQFAVIALCFRRATAEVDEIRIKAPADPNVRISDEVRSTAEHRLGAIVSMSNVFRCYAQRRLEYYYGLRERAILSPGTIVRRLLNRQNQMASDHLNTSDQRCALE